MHVERKKLTWGDTCLKRGGMQGRCGVSFPVVSTVCSWKENSGTELAMQGHMASYAFCVLCFKISHRQNRQSVFSSFVVPGSPAWRFNRIYRRARMKVVTSEQMQALDRQTIEDLGIHGLILMENAGRGTAEIVMSQYAAELSGKGALVVAGPGNNGGDGFVIARHLVQAGIRTDIVVLAPEEKFRGDALVNLEIVKALGIPLVICTDESILIDQLPLFEDAGVIVDALFGTGLGRPLEGRFARAVRYINRSHAPVAAVDIASGLSSDTGHPLGTAVKADITCTMAMPKIGHVTWPGCDYTGELHVVEIGIPGFLIEKAGITTEAFGKDEFSALLKPRPDSGHKGTFGHLVVIGGSRGKTGAAALAAAGALHSGAGLVTVACAASSQPVLAAKLTEAMTCALPETGDGSPSQAAYDGLIAALKKKRAVVLGPGLGLHTDTREFALRIMKEVDIPVVVDADALTAMAEDMKAFSDKDNLVLTPHPGEMARLCGCTVQEAQADRIKSATELARGTGAVVVLKGARTVTAAPDGRVCINTTGNSGLGTGGMGDVLSGIIGALLVQGYEPWDAARLGVCAHGLAADLLASGRGPWGWTAGDLVLWLPRVWGIACRK